MRQSLHIETDETADFSYGLAVSPRVAIVCSDAGEAEALAEDVAICGGVATIGNRPGAALAFRHCDAVVLDVRGMDTIAMAELLGEWAGEKSKRLVIADSDVIDVAYIFADGEEAAIVIGDSRAERLAALAELLQRNRGAVRELDNQASGDHIRELTEAVAALTRQLERVSGQESPRASVASQSGVAVPAFGFRNAGTDVEHGLVSPGDRSCRDTSPREDNWLDPVMVRNIIRSRRMRAQFFDDTLFSDPAWDMLLDLTAARLEGHNVSVSSLCIAAHVPPTTALRWIKAMTDGGVFERSADRYDARRAFIRLSDAAFHQMEQLLSHALAGEQMPVI